MNIWAIIPIKPFNRSKSRLAKVLSPEQRASLAERMFRHSLEVLTSVEQIAGILVISRDTGALAIARDYGVHTVQESGTPELNAALLRASQVIGSQGVDGVFVLPADIPFVNAEDVQEILHLGRYNMTVVLAPDRNEEGTNALLVNPPGLIQFSFGIGSFRRHMIEADEAGATVKIYRSEQISLDIDVPEDLALYYQLTGQKMIVPNPVNGLSITE